MPVQTAVALSTWKPLMNSWPRPPTPMSAPTLTSEIVETAAARNPATRAGAASGSSTASSRRRSP